MKGKVVKQINNLKITKDTEARLYRVYSPDGVELYNSNSSADVKARCEACFDYCKKPLYKYFDIYVSFEEDGVNDGYSVFFKTTEDIKHEADIIAYAVQHNLFSEDGDEEYVANIREISAEEYKRATE